MLSRLTESSIQMSLSIFSAEKKVNCAENWKHTNWTYFFYQRIQTYQKTHYNVRMVLLRCAPVVMEYADLPIEPITQNQITQIALWRDSKKSPVVEFFIGCLNKFAVDQSQM